MSETAATKQEPVYRKPDLVERRGGEGPEQPVWRDISRYSTEWYLRFRDWHREQFPNSDAGTRANLDMLIGIAKERDQYRIEADCAMRDYDALELEHNILKRVTAKRSHHDYSGMGF